MILYACHANVQITYLKLFKLIEEVKEAALMVRY